MPEPLISSDSTSDLKIKDSSGIYPHQFLQKLEQSASTAQLKVMTGQQTAVGFSRAKFEPNICHVFQLKNDRNRQTLNKTVQFDSYKLNG